MRSILSTLALAGLLAAGLSAAPITVTEPPDFPGSGGPNFVLEIGVNTISGNVSGCPSCIGSDYQDNFSLTLPAGMHVTSGFLTGSYESGGGANPQLACFSHFGCFGTGFFDGSGGNIFSGSSNFNFTATSPWSTLTAVFPGSSSYTLSVTVAADVPEPATALLVIPALGALALIRRRA